MVGPGSLSSPRLRWHRFVEHYTPDGGLGRFLFAIASGSVAVFAFWVAAVGLTSFGFLPTIAGFVGLGTTIVAALLAVVVLWPVYLSLIGNVESAAAYATAVAEFPSATDGDDPIAVLQHRYAVGELSQEAFERRLDDLLGVEDRVEAADASPPTRPGDVERLEDTADR